MNRVLNPLLKVKLSRFQLFRNNNELRHTGDSRLEYFIHLRRAKYIDKNKENHKYRYISHSSNALSDLSVMSFAISFEIICVPFHIYCRT